MTNIRKPAIEICLITSRILEAMNDRGIRLLEMQLWSKEEEQTENLFKL
jgi:hypothetical protein